MKPGYTFLGACFAVTLAACGGSSSSTAGANNTGVAGTTRIETQLVSSTNIPPLDQTGPAGCALTFKYIDSTNFEAGDSYQFVLASYDSKGNRTVLPASGWLSTDTTSTYGIVSFDRGIFVSNGAQTKSGEQVSVSFNGQTYRTSYDVLPLQARVRGQVLDHKTNAPIQGVEIDFYGPNSPTDSSIVARGKVVTQADGTFQGSVPAPTALSNFQPTEFFQINNSSLAGASENGLPVSLQRSFAYNGNVFETGLLSCVATMQVPGTSTLLPLQVGNNDLLSIAGCTSGQPTVTANGGWIFIYNAAEEAPAPTGCS